MRLRITSLILLLTSALAGLILPPIVADAQPYDIRTTEVFPGLYRQEIRLRLDDGKTAVAHVLSYSSSDSRYALRGVLGQDKIPGLETIPSMGRRVVASNGIAGVNGGFWLRNPVGDPNSYMSIGRRLISEAETQGAGPRGTLARRGNGTLIMDRIDTKLTLQVNDLPPTRRVTALNRFHRSTPPYADDAVQPLYLYTPEFGATVDIKPIVVNEAPLPMRAFMVQGLVPRPSGPAEGLVSTLAVVPGVVTIPRDGVVVVAHGEAATGMATVVPGDRMRLDVEVLPLDSPASDWDDIVDALAAGPLIVRKGERVDPGSWEHEGFAPSTHSNVRHPRTAAGLTADGRVLLVTVDGRQSGYSAGMTMHEVAHFLRTLGVRDGLSLDGGGSSQMVTDGVLRNRPCCDKSLRPVATGLFIFHNYDFTSAERIYGSGREATAAAVALHSHPAGSKEVLVAAADNFPDALAGGPLAHSLGAPLLLTGKDALPAATNDALTKLAPQRITILGGPSAVSLAVEEKLRERFEVRRLSGKGRAETAIAIARDLGEQHERVFLARADAFPDALSAAAPGGLLGMPILLTNSTVLSADVMAYLVAAGVREVIVLGGQRAVADTVTDEMRVREIAVTRLAGTSRFGTAAAVNRWAAPRLSASNPTGVVIAAGGTFPDALAGGPFAAGRRQLLMIAPTDDINADPEAKAFFDELGAGPLERVVVIGGHSVLSSLAHWQLDRLAKR